ncbi:MAG: hypothetical protein CMH41_04495 [Micrococcales bacterium]|nr:hypothetical protein [Micrococcales bacterium]
MARRVIVWRHGQTEWNMQRRFQGHQNVDLDETGRDQVAAAAKVIARRQPTAIATSDLARAKSTAQALEAETGCSARLDSDLRETFCASWEGLTHEEIMKQDGLMFQAWLMDHRIRPGGTGETITEVGGRAAAAVEQHLVDVPSGETLVVVTHGGSARALVGHLMEWPPESWRRLGVLDNAAWAELLFGVDGSWRLLAYNKSAG